MEFEELTKSITARLKPKLESSPALAAFASERSGFEGWLKVEICEILLESFNAVTPERDRIDVAFDDWAIQLKTIPTSYMDDNSPRKTKSMPQNVDSVVEDIGKLRDRKVINGMVLFVAYPVTHDRPDWQHQVQKVLSKVSRLSYENFAFTNGVPGVIYFGLV